jgi:predicted dehydrogenase
VSARSEHLQTGTVRLGLLGCGLVALAVHLKNRSRFDGATIAAVAEPDPARLARARQVAPEVAAHADFSPLHGDASNDAVVISVPYAEHASAT